MADYGDMNSTEQMYGPTISGSDYLRWVSNLPIQELHAIARNYNMPISQEGVTPVAVAYYLSQLHPFDQPNIVGANSTINSTHPVPNPNRNAPGTYHPPAPRNYGDSQREYNQLQLEISGPEEERMIRMRNTPKYVQSSKPVVPMQTVDQPIQVPQFPPAVSQGIESIMKATMGGPANNATAFRRGRQ